MNFRKILFLILFLFLCLSAKAGDVSEEYAAKIAAKLLDKGIGASSSSVRKVRPRNLNGSEHPAYYIFAGGDGQGFAIVSACDATIPILGFSKIGSVDEIPVNMQNWLDRMQTNIEEIREQKLEPTEDVKSQWEQLKIGKAKVELVTASWGQNSPFSDECPSINGQKCFTGCVATAYAILMKYYGSPSYGIGVTEPYYTETEKIYVPSRDLDHFYDWSNMPLSYDKGYTTAQGKEVARLMADIGSAIQLDYCKTGTSGHVGEPGIVAHFNYAAGNHLRRSNYTDLQWHSLLQEELDMRAPILYDGNTNASGHAFIIDGYTDDNYYHVNWGWSGSYNGYFLLDRLVPTIGHDYSNNSTALIGFKPLEYVNADEAVAVVDGTLCPDFDTALALSGYTHQTAKMLQDVKIDYRKISSTESFSLDLNGKCLETEGIYNYGSLSITDTEGNGKMTTDKNYSVIQNHGTLTIESGEFSNTAETCDEESDYRRVIWAAEDSNTIINGGTFTNVAGNQCLCLQGTAVIEDGEFVHHGNSTVIANYSTTGSLVVNGGIFTNTAETCDEESDYRRVIWTAEDSNTIINGGTFTSVAGSQCLCLHGTVVIEDGEFVHCGNSTVIANYSTTGSVIINGGTFTNTAVTYTGQSDYRRVFYTAEDSNTVINGGTFDCPYAPWNLLLYGTVTINNADIKTSYGTDCYVKGDCVVNYARMAGKYNINNKGHVVVYRGLYSKQVASSMLDSQSRCVSNNDVSTKAKYPYAVIRDEEDGIANIEMDSTASPMYYNLAGQHVKNANQGIIEIIRNANTGASRKQLKK